MSGDKVARLMAKLAAAEAEHAKYVAWAKRHKVLEEELEKSRRDGLRRFDTPAFRAQMAAFMEDESDLSVLDRCVAAAAAGACGGDGHGKRRAEAEDGGSGGKGEGDAVLSRGLKRRRGAAVAAPAQTLESLEASLDRFDCWPALEVAHSPRAVAEYRRFLVLKALDRDIKIGELRHSPPFVVDQVWHSHMLMPQSYAAVCAALLGPGGSLLFEHDTATASSANRATRFAYTKRRYREVFREDPPGLIYDEQRASDDGTVSAPRSNTITIKVMAHDNTKFYFKVSMSTPFRRLMDAYCEERGVPSGSFRFVFEADRLRPEETPSDVGMEDEDVVIANAI